MKWIASIVAGVSIIGLAAAAVADEPAAAKPRASEASAKPEAEQRLERIKKLAGAWESGDEDGAGMADTQAYYRIVSGGTAVAEFLMRPGGTGVSPV
ncbi:hypothetical protein RAS1_28690 [Phycisphaerae bacterium RAS1]|nr:hypothetical protein RAS1_28690 [Phycisphaerae bacterium RAS1]